jgi:(2Fe-2S) ferredoxin
MDEPTHRLRCHICLGQNCGPKGSPALLKRMQAAVVAAGLADEVEVLGTSCRNRCLHGPSVNVYPGPVLYNWVTPEAVDRIVDGHFRGGTVVDQYEYTIEKARLMPTTGRRRR